MKLSILKMSAAALCALMCSASTAFAGEVSEFKFRETPVNAMGVTGMADLLGKPVLIDFWGTK